MRAERLAKLESHTRAAHTAAWSAFFQRFRAALDAVPAGVLEGPFRAVDLDELSDLEPELRAWDEWCDAVLPVLERGEAGDLSVWPNDLPPPPGDPQPLISELISRWRRKPRLPLAAMLVLLALAVAVGEGGSPSSEAG